MHDLPAEAFRLAREFVVANARLGERAERPLAGAHADLAEKRAVGPDLDRRGLLGAVGRFDDHREGDALFVGKSLSGKRRARS